MSRAGLTNHSASGEPIRNLGQQTVEFHDGQQRRCGMHFQLAEVDRPLISVARRVDAGNRVDFGPMGGHITHLATGRRAQLVRDGNIFTLDMHLPPLEGKGASRNPLKVRQPRVSPGRSGAEGDHQAQYAPERAGPLRKSYASCASTWST